MVNYIFNVVIQAIEEWIPKRKYAKEDKYRDDLMRFLRERLSSQDFTIGKGALLDIEINDVIGIELKRNLKRKTKIDRLVGQITRFMNEHSYALVVLCGDVEQKTVKDLNNLLKRYTSNSRLVQNKILKIISKDTSQILREKNKRTLIEKINKPHVLSDYVKQTQKRTKPKT